MGLRSNAQIHHPIVTHTTAISVKAQSGDSIFGGDFKSWCIGSTAEFPKLEFSQIRFCQAKQCQLVFLQNLFSS